MLESFTLCMPYSIFNFDHHIVDTWRDECSSQFIERGKQLYPQLILSFVMHRNPNEVRNENLFPLWQLCRGKLTENWRKFLEILFEIFWRKNFSDPVQNVQESETVRRQGTRWAWAKRNTVIAGSNHGTVHMCPIVIFDFPTYSRWNCFPHELGNRESLKYGINTKIKLWIRMRPSRKKKKYSACFL